MQNDAHQCMCWSTHASGSYLRVPSGSSSIHAAGILGYSVAMALELLIIAAPDGAGNGLFAARGSAFASCRGLESFHQEDQCMQKLNSIPASPSMTSKATRCTQGALPTSTMPCWSRQQAGLRNSKFGAVSPASWLPKLPAFGTSAHRK